jgi:hypothetical protein
MPSNKELGSSSLTVGSAEAIGHNCGSMLSRYLEEEPTIVERLLFARRKEDAAAQQSSCKLMNENKAARFDDASGIELAGGDLMEELNAIVARTSRKQK